MREAEVYGLCVVSSDGQEDTLPYQRAWLQETAQKNGWTVTRVFEGVSSGKLGVRSIVREMVDAIKVLPKAQRPRRVLLIRTDRLGREPLEVIALLAEIRNLGVIIHTRTDGDMALTKASEAILPMVQTIVAGVENEVRRDKINTAYTNKKKRREEHRKHLQAVEGRAIAVSPRAPYGLRWENGYYVPKPPESDAIRLAYEMKCSGYGAHTIAKKLAEIAPPLTRKNGEIAPQHWRNDRVLQMLRLDVYRGVVVDEPTWARAQKPVREIVQPTRKHEWPLGGALTCACGTPLVGLAGGRPDRWRHYLCRDKFGAHGGKSVTYRNTKVEAQFEEMLRRLVASPDLVATYTQRKDGDRDRKLMLARLSQLKAELAKHEERRKRLFRGYEDGVVSDADYRERMAELKAEHGGQQSEADAIEQELAMANARRVSAAHANKIIADAARIWAKASNDDRRAISKAVARLVGGLIVRRDGTLVAGATLRKTTTRDETIRAVTK